MVTIADADRWNIYHHHIGRVYWRCSLGSIEPVNAKVSTIAAWARAQRGNWAAIVETSTGTHLVTDTIRSFPILYLRQANRWVVSSTPRALLRQIPNLQINRDAAAEFRHTGFVLGSDTLLDNVHTVTAGHALTLDPDGTTTEIEHTPFVYDSRMDMTEDAFLRIFHEQLLDLFSQFLADARGRQIVVPLSGGADSRLLVALLKHVGASHVLTFTYGTAGSKEVAVSREVAETIGYPWISVPTDPHRMRAQWYRPQTAEFLADTWSGNALPHIQDWYALTQLTQSEAIDADAIVLPGHTVVGKIHDYWCVDPTLPFSIEDMTRMLSTHHLALQGHPEFGWLTAYTRSKIVRFLRRYWPDEAPRARQSAMIGFNLAERQAKYISNSMRAYEHFGLSWSLPMQQQPVWETWLRAPATLLDPGRTRYVEYANREYSRFAGDKLDYFGAPAQRLPKTPVRMARTILTRAGLLNHVNNLYRAGVELRHPMGYEALRGSLSRAELARRLLAGTNILGVYADLFLTNSWVPGASVIPPPSVNRTVV
ncbi:MAG: asparagine synthase-related protein [Actinomycetaceae bacterium]|nr:asparagine synthase-related protein [Actinomycetaceae bacterium]